MQILAGQTGSRVLFSVGIFFVNKDFQTMEGCDEYIWRYADAIPLSLAQEHTGVPERWQVKLQCCSKTVTIPFIYETVFLGNNN